MSNSTKFMYAFWAFLVLLVCLDNYSGLPPRVGSYYLATTLFSAGLALGWLLADAKEINVKPSPLLKASVVAISIIAVPYYLVRYKGWKRSLRSLGKFLKFLIAYFLIAFIVVYIKQNA